MRDWEKRVAGIDWQDFPAAHTEASAVLSELWTTGGLTELIERIPARPELAAKCEHLRSLDKLVLWADPASDVRLRLHLFKDRYLDLPHNHRWTFTSLMLGGGYTHFLYGPMTADTTDALPEARSLTPTCVQEVGVGDVYTLDHTHVHALAADSSAVTLVLRGPVMKKRAIWFDRTTNESWLHEGGPGDTRMEPMSAGALAAVVDHALTMVRA